MSNSPDRLARQIALQIQQIDRLFVEHAELLAGARQAAPNSTELLALGAVLHAFYNGVENCFLRIATLHDGQVPSGGESHRELFLQMMRPTERRQAVLSEQLAHTLADYRGFRHFFRHAYTYRLQWSEMAELVEGLSDVWQDVRESMLRFLDSLGPRP